MRNSDIDSLLVGDFCNAEVCNCSLCKGYEMNRCREALLAVLRYPGMLYVKCTL